MSVKHSNSTIFEDSSSTLLYPFKDSPESYFNFYNIYSWLQIEPKFPSYPPITFISTMASTTKKEDDHVFPSIMPIHHMLFFSEQKLRV